MNVIPFGTEKATVVPVEIKVPPCAGTCILSIQHSGKIVFIEERDVNAANFPAMPITTLKDDKIDWTVERDGYQFASLFSVFMKIELKDKSTKRKFVLEKLTYGYGANGPDKLVLYNRLENGGKPSKNLQIFEWNPAG